MDYGAIMMDGGILIIAKPVGHILNMSVIVNKHIKISLKFAKQNIYI